MIDTRHGINSSSPASTRPATARAPTAPAADKPATAATSSEVSLSERGRALQALERAVMSAESGRAERLAEVRAQVADGSYRVDSTQLASKLLQADWGRQ